MCSSEPLGSTSSCSRSCSIYFRANLDWLCTDAERQSLASVKEAYFSPWESLLNLAMRNPGV